MKPSVLFLLGCLAIACTEDTRQPRDASVPSDGSLDARLSDNDAGDDDADMDGVFGFMDLCPATAGGDPIDASGCSTADSDDDGVLNDMDRCADTPEGANVDGLGCRLENEGTLDVTWLIEGAAATAASCSAASITQVRLIVDRPGANFLMRDFPCAQGGFDGREDMSAPRVPRGESFSTYWQALNAGGSVIAETNESALILRDVEHGTLTSPDFVLAD